MSMFPNIFGAYQSRDLPNITIPQVGEQSVQADIQAWADFYNQTVGLYTGTLATEGTDAIGNFGSGAGGGEMQAYTEYGETEATRAGEAKWAWGVGIRRYRDRQIYTEEYLQTATLEKINRDVIYATMRNLTTRIKNILRAILYNVNYVFVEDETFPGTGIGNVNVVRLFNADNSPATMVVNNQIVGVGTLQSYVPSTVAGISIANFTLGRSILKARGLVGHIAHIISPLDADAVRAMAGFIPRTIDNPYVNVQNGPQTTVTTAVVNRPQSIGVFSNGGTADGEVIVYPFFPQTYTLSLDTSQEPPAFIRQRPEAQFRGFRLVQDDTKMDYGAQALRNKRWEYIAGVGVRNRANGVVVQGTTGAYTAPTI